jgi:hypothetical protein
MLAVDLHHRSAELVTVAFHLAPDMEGVTRQGLGVFTRKLDPDWTAVTEFPSEDAPPFQLRYHPQHGYGVVKLVL